ncbi:hypothetical protein BH18ACT11_BH18ACT11_29950 [soil metagenome]
MERQVADERVVDGEDVQPEDAPPGGVFSARPSLLCARDLRGPFEPVERREPDECHQVDVILEKGEVLADGVQHGLLLLGKVGQEVDEDVGHGDAARRREPAAAGGGVQEAYPPRKEMYQGQPRRQDER